MTTVTDITLPPPHTRVPVRVYAPAAPTGHGLVWAHGGAFAGGELEMPESDWVARRLSGYGVTVVCVDYSLAPRRDLGPNATGVHYPVASDEISAVFHWAAGSGLTAGPWALGGASAGGNLAAGAGLRLVHEEIRVPALLVLAYPTLHAVQETPDAELRALLDASPEADVFGADEMRSMYENYLGGALDEADIYAIPGTASSTQLRGFPPTIIVSSDVDELRVSGETFAQSLRAAGVEVEISTEAGTRHGHLNRPEERAASLSIERIAARILRPHRTAASHTHTESGSRPQTMPR